MSSLAIAGIAFACILVGTLSGMLVARVLPSHHLSGDSKDAVKQGLALIATLTALVLGLLVATTKGTFDSQSAAVKELAANMVLLDRILSRYAPGTDETKEARESLAGVVKVMLEQMWPEQSGQSTNLTTGGVRVAGEALFDKISALKPITEDQKQLKSRALDIGISLAQTAPAAVSAEREFDSTAVPGNSGILAHHSVRQLRPSRSAQPDRRHGPDRLHVVSVGSPLFGSGNGQTVRRHHARLQRPLRSALSRIGE